MSNIIPFSSVLRNLNNWSDFWDDDDFQIIPSVSNNLEVYETKNQVVVKANVAGVDADDVDVTFEKGVLWIRAKAKQEEKTDDHKYYSKSSWSYSYSVAVPGMIDHSKEPELTIENGILKIVFEKSEASKPKKLKIKK